MEETAKRTDVFPESLRDALKDTFSYMLGTKSGYVFEFEHASWKGDDWITLHGVSAWNVQLSGAGNSPNFGRGLEVHLDDVAWCAKAPWGS